MGTFIRRVLSIQKTTGDARGFTLVEVLVALGVFGIVAVTFATGLSGSLIATMVSQERVSADSLAKSQMEDIKNQEYDDSNPPVYSELAAEEVPEGYDIVIVAERLDPKGDGTGEDDGIQKITVIIEHNGEQVFQLEDFKLIR